MAAYPIVDSEVTNSEGMQEYLGKVGATIALHGGKPVVLGGDVEVVEGDWTPKRIVVMEFPSMDAAKAWYNAPAYREIIPIRQAAANDRPVFVDGL